MLTIRQKKLRDSWLYFNTLSLLGRSLLGQKKYAEAGPLLLKGYEGMKQREAKIPAAGKARLTEAADRLAHLYEATRKKTETKLQGKLTDAKKEHVHEVKLTAGQPVFINLQSKQFDTLLRLEDAKGKKLAENDDIDYQSKKLDSLILFTPKQDGTYRIVATSFQQRRRGAYDIVVRKFGPKVK